MEVGSAGGRLRTLHINKNRIAARMAAPKAAPAAIPTIAAVLNPLEEVLVVASNAVLVV